MHIINKTPINIDTLLDNDSSVDKRIIIPKISNSDLNQERFNIIKDIKIDNEKTDYSYLNNLFRDSIKYPNIKR